MLIHTSDAITFCKGFGIVEISCFTTKNAGKDYHSEMCIQTPSIRQPLILRGSLAQEHCSMSPQYCVQMPFRRLSRNKIF